MDKPYGTNDEINNIRASTSKRPVHIVGLVCTLFLLGTVILCVSLYFFSTNKPPKPNISSSQLSSLDYDIFIPSELPEGYTYESDSVTVNSQLVLFKLNDGSKVITINQQPKPNQETFISSLAGFDKLETPNGTSYTGKNKSYPTALIETKETLVTISGTPDVSSDIINALMKSLQKFN